MHMVNPFHTVGQAAADFVQKLDDEERAARVALCRVAAPTTLSDMLSGKSGKTFDDHKADALLEIQAERAAQQRTAALLADAERVRKAAQQRTAALLADAEREGRESALAAHMAKQGAKPPPATEPARPALTFEQARMLQRVAVDADEQFSRDLAAGAPHKPQEVYIDEAARRYLAAQPAPATPQQVAHLPEQAQPPRKRYYRLGWRQTPAFDHVVNVYASTKSITWKELEKALRDKATDETPVGLLKGRFFIRDLGRTVGGKTISHAMPAIRKAAAKLPRNPHPPAKHSRE